MTLNRRRFLTITASFACAPALAQASTWQGRAFGADVSITLHGPQPLRDHALMKARVQITAIEKLFSLYDPASDLSTLNAFGFLQNPDQRFLSLMQGADEIHTLTRGLFDPTIQPLWRALAQGTDTARARRVIGWNRVSFDADKVQLGIDQALTFNGIAQGFATDEITQALKAQGVQKVLINIGEYRALGGPWRLGLNDPTVGHIGTRTLSDMAIATSSPGAMSLGTASHILHPVAAPKWSTVSVEAQTATLADGLSTAMTLATWDQIAHIKATCPGLGRITLVSMEGDVATL